MEILVTGGTGKIGRKLIPVLIDNGHRISVLVRNKEKACSLLPPECRVVIGDITDPNSIQGCCDGIDIVYHLVGISGNERPSEREFARYRKVNVEGLRNVINEAKGKVKRFIYVSSIAAMGIVKEMPISPESVCRPYNPYQVSKYEAEQLILQEVKDNQFPAIILRPSQVYGAGGEYSYQNIMKMIKVGLMPKMREALVSHCYIDDLISTLTCVVDKGKCGSIYICTTEKSIGFYESVRLISSLMNRKVVLVPVSRWIIYSIAFFIEKICAILGRTPFVTRSNIIAMTTDRIYDLSKNKEDLGFTSSVTMEEGIRRCVLYNLERGI